jgi:hypothetical protein
MNKMRLKMKALIGILLVAMILTSSINLPFAYATPEAQQSQVWSFGVISDTQWTVADDGFNPNTSAINIATQVDKQFINAGVKFVIAVGDTVDVGSATSIGTRALYAQALYNAGIGFYPLRGNHEAAETPPDLTSGQELRYAFPQIGTGVNNNTPADITTALITATDLVNIPPAAKTGITFTVGANFTEPTAVNTANNSVSYAFQYGNATFMLLDQFDVTGNYYNSTVPQQQDWISATLSSRPANTHAFVFAHKNLLGGNHKDNLFGGPVVTSDPGDGWGVITTTLTPSELITLTAKQTAMNNFIASMQANQVDYFFTGHDHHHYVSIVTSPDGLSKVRQIIGQSDSSKFYTPVTPFSKNDAPIEQDLYKVGYYIFTVDGPRVTVDYYADTIGGNYFGLQGGKFNFVKVSSIHYSLNGKEKLVAQKGSYVMADDTTVAETLETGFKHTSMSILAGANASTSATNYGKALNNNVTTAWKASDSSLSSDILNLNGMARTLGGIYTDQYVISMTYTAGTISDTLINAGLFGILTRNGQNGWINAVNKNLVGIPTHFVLGPWNSSYPLGAYGVDTATHTAWAVLNYNGDFAVGSVSLYLPVVLK